MNWRREADRRLKDGEKVVDLWLVEKQNGQFRHPLAKAFYAGILVGVTGIFNDDNVFLDYWEARAFALKRGYSKIEFITLIQI